MSHFPYFHSLMAPPVIEHGVDSLLENIPFGLDDYAAVNNAFEHAASGDRRALYDVETWTYCFVYRYLAYKFTSCEQAPVSDFDEMVEATYFHIRRNRLCVRQTGAYSMWVRVVCRNLFINYLRRPNPRFETGAELIANEEVGFEDLDDTIDAGLLVETLESVIAELPLFLQETATLRLMANLEYKEISEQTGKPLMLVRTYTHKATMRIRESGAMRSFYKCLKSTP
jgi:RNA polymerase sigma factor (sigma-70 family)